MVGLGGRGMKAGLVTVIGQENDSPGLDGGIA